MEGWKEGWGDGGACLFSRNAANAACHTLVSGMFLPLQLESRSTPPHSPTRQGAPAASPMQRSAHRLVHTAGMFAGKSAALMYHMSGL